MGSKRFERLSEELNAFNLSPLAWGLEAELSAIADKLTSLAENSVGETDWDQAAREIVGALKECDIPVALTQNREISSGAKIVRHILITYAKTRSRLSDDAFVKALSRALKDRN